jgi:predicted acylesterase/phospholipase RssA
MLLTLALLTVLGAAPVRAAPVRAAPVRAAVDAGSLDATVDAGSPALITPVLDGGQGGLDRDSNQLSSTLQSTTIVVSGGVSLGSYQAGLLYLYTQYMLAHRAQIAKIAPELMSEPVIATGASAGSINAFLAAIAVCRKPIPRPEDSLFWQVWMPVGLDGLVDTEDVTPYSLLSRKPINRGVDLMKLAWNDSNWSPETCRINLGMTVTREVPRPIPLNSAAARDEGKVTLPIQTERVVLVMEGEGGRAPSVNSWNPPVGAPDKDFFVDFDVHSPQGGVFPEELTKLLQASSAFPVAWPPVLLHMRGDPSYGYFLDGGVFDNNPVHLATHLLNLSGPLGDKMASAGIAQSRLKRALPSRLLYVEPDATPWADELAAVSRRRDSFVTLYSQLALSLVGTARKAELVSTLQYDTALREQIDVPQRNWPIAGAFMLNFFAFLEEDFRRFDFYSGMADALEFLHASSERSDTRLGLSDLRVVSPEFACVVEFRRGDGETKAVDIPECKALVQQSKEPDRATNLLALLETSARMREAIRECVASKNCEQGIEFTVFSRELALNGYKFTDPALQHASVIGAVREKLHPLVQSFADKQPFPDSSVIAMVGKGALDSVEVRPSDWYLGLGMLSRSGVEAEYSRHLIGPFRPFTIGARVLRLQTSFLETGGSPVEGTFSGTAEAYWTPLAIEFNPVQPWWYFRLGFSAGLAAETTMLGLHPAVARLPLEANITTLFLQRFYLRATYKSYALDGCPTSDRCILLTPEAKANPSQVAGLRADFMMSVGFHFID